MITLYSASWCPACKALKKQLDAEGFEYVTKMLDDENVLLEAQKIGVKSIPVIYVDDLQAQVRSSEALKNLLASQEGYVDRENRDS